MGNGIVVTTKILEGSDEDYPYEPEGTPNRVREIL